MKNVSEMMKMVWNKAHLNNKLLRTYYSFAECNVGVVNFCPGSQFMS